MSTRRVVTGKNEAGRSCFVHDGPTAGHVDLGVAVVDELWIDDPANPDPAARVDPATVATIRLSPPVGGSVVRVLTFLPARAGVVKDFSHCDTGDAVDEQNPDMHTTRTIDYGIVLSGELDLELDEGAVHLTAGDVVVQRGTRHAWHNRGTVPCTVAFVMISSPNYR